MMDLRKKKYRIIEALLAVKEPKVIRDVEEILRINAEGSLQNDLLTEEGEDVKKNGRTPSDDVKVKISDWDYEVSETERLFIKAGLKDIAEGNTFTNEEVLREINTKYGL